MPAVPNVFNQNYLGSLADFRTMMNNRYGWGNAKPGPGPMPAAPQPNPLANDATSFIKPGGAPLQIGGMQGGMGMPGYVNPGVPGYGGGSYNPGNRGPGQGGW